MLFKDLRLKSPPRFSLTHCLFFVAVLYRLSHRAIQVDIVIWENLEWALLSATDRFSASLEGGINLATLVPVLAMVCHFFIFSLVSLFGALALRLAAVRHACVHLLFYFQFFDIFFVYVFFNLRSASVAVTPTWVIMQVIMQVWVVLRNSGTNDALIARSANKSGAFVAFLACSDYIAGFREADALRDPLYRLQFLARMSVQADLADLSAIVLTPAAVCFFVWRDGWFSLEGTGILVRHCDLGPLLTRFALLLLIKPIGSTIARCLLIRKMRKTLLGKRTIHGRSLVAVKAIAHKRTLHCAPDDMALDEEKQQRELSLTEEELMAVHDELLLAALDFRCARDWARWSTHPLGCGASFARAHSCTGLVMSPSMFLDESDAALGC